MALTSGCLLRLDPEAGFSAAGLRHDERKRVLIATRPLAEGTRLA
jgi:hypothetical protein